jgi:hypothetical protein
MDPLHLVVSETRLRRRVAWGAALTDLLTPTSLDPPERDLVERAAASAGVSVRTSMVLYWLLTIESSHRRHPGTVRSRPWIRANVVPVLEALR